MSAVGTDEYVDFCEGVRQICGLDLSQYKRPQMERRLRSFLGSPGRHPAARSPRRAAPRSGRAR